MGDQVYGVGIAAEVGRTQALELREGHPSQHPGFQLNVTAEDGIVSRADLTVGFMHRGAEKLFESRDYRQLMMLANRHDWLSAFHSELLVALALEESMGIVPPPRATWTRMLLAEANRVAVALAFIAPVLPQPQRQVLLDARETLLLAQERATGARMHPMYARIGGVAHGLDGESLDVFTAASAATNRACADVADALTSLMQEVRGIGVLSTADAMAFGASGAVGHASGIAFDIRRDSPYLAYSEVIDLIPEQPAAGFLGDAAGRYQSLAAQIDPSLQIVDAAVAKLRDIGDEPFDVTLPKTVRAPEGMTSMSIEGPLGIMGALLVSDGDRMPWRLRLRTASYNNAQAMQSALPGTSADRLADAVMSFFLVVGDIDR